MKRVLLVWLLMCGAASGQTLTLPQTVNVPVGKEFVLSGKTDCVSVIWYFPDGELTAGISLEDLYEVPATWKKKQGAIQLNSGPIEKVYRVVAVGANAKGQQTPAQVCLVVVGKAPPVPPGPEPPKPPVPPVPPTPTPDPAPIVEEGFRVLVVFQDKELAKLPIKQQSILFSKNVRAYLNDKCASDNGGQKAYWFLDAEAKFADNMPPWVKRTFDRKRDAVPWIIVSNGKTGWEGPLPKDETETLTLLKKYGGN